MITNGKEPHVNKIRVGIKKLNNLLSLAKIPLQVATQTGHILVEINPAPDFCKFVCQKSSSILCDTCVSRLQDKNNSDFFHFACPFGLYNFAVPIFSPKDYPRLYLIGGQVYSEEAQYHKYMIPVDKLAKEKGLSTAVIAKTIGQIDTMEMPQLEIYERMSKYIAHNLSESINTPNTTVARLSLEKELLEKKIIDLETKNSFLLVNPHFLFNTLNTIARVAYFEHAAKTEELIYCLSDLLRYNLKQDNNLHPLSDELENIKKYLYIQKIRLKNRLNYEIDIPETILQHRIPNMILQPIVENALLHGITPKHDVGLIRITAEQQGNSYFIYVSDNGYGFPDEVLKSLTERDFSKIETTTTKSGIGLLSTNKRIQYFFGSSYGLSIKHSDFTGSTVGLFLPVK